MNLSSRSCRLLAMLSLRQTLTTPSKSSHPSFSPSLNTSTHAPFAPFLTSPLTSASLHCFLIHTFFFLSSSPPSPPEDVSSAPMPPMSSLLASHNAWSVRDHSSNARGEGATMCSVFHLRSPARARDPLALAEEVSGAV